MKQFLCVLTPCRPTLPVDATERERAIVGEHFAYWQEMLGAGRLVLLGRTQDLPPMGLIVLEADDAAAAQRMVDGDPAVARGVMSAVVRPYAVALMRGHG